MKKTIKILGVLFLFTLFSCDPGARYFRMRKSRGIEFPKDECHLSNALLGKNS